MGALIDAIQEEEGVVEFWYGLLLRCALRLYFSRAADSEGGAVDSCIYHEPDEVCLTRQCLFRGESRKPSQIYLPLLLESHASISRCKAQFTQRQESCLEAGKELKQQRSFLLVKLTRAVDCLHCMYVWVCSVRASALTESKRATVLVSGERALGAGRRRAASQYMECVTRTERALH